MGFFDGVLFCVDCDHTLTDSKSELSKKNVEAIREFQEEGGLFTFASGRFPKYIHRFLPYFKPNTYQIMGNGTSLYDIEQETMIWEVTVEPAKEALRYIVKEGLCDVLFVDHRTHSTMWCRDDDFWPWKDVSFTTDIEEVIRTEDEPWHKVNFVFKTPEDNLRVRTIMGETFPMYQFVRSWPTGMELLPLRGGKGNCLLELRKILGDKVHTVVAAGDFENDASMLRIADYGYAVANASKECKEAANRQTVSCDENAIYAIVEELKELL